MGIIHGILAQQNEVDPMFDFQEEIRQDRETFGKMKIGKGKSFNGFKDGLPDMGFDV